MALPIATIAFLLTLAYLVFSIYKYVTRKPNTFDRLPWVGLPSGPFAKFRARFARKDVRDDFVSSWHQYSSKGKAFISPTFLGSPTIILPASLMQWLADQPESNLSMHEHLRESMALDLTLLDKTIVDRPLHETVIRNELTRSLGSTLEPVRIELLRGLDAIWGTSTEWHDICLWESLTKLIARASGRVIVGEELCRNEQYTDSAVGFAVSVTISGLLMRAIPMSLRDMVQWLFTRRNRNYFDRAAQFLLPLIERRKADIARAERDKTFKYEEPCDVLQWNIRSGIQHPDPREWATLLIAKRCMATNFAAIHTTSIMSTHILFDIASSPVELRVLAILREEAFRVFQESGGVWSKGTLSKLTRLDSVVRESLRLGSLGALGLNRKVVAKGGLATPDGDHLPEGSLIALHAYGNQMMDGIYEDAATWKPFRFSDARESLRNEQTNGVSGEKQANEYLKELQMTSAMTGPGFLTFGHGRHACPGRFFAIQEIKLLVAHVILNFDFQHMDKRPQNTWIGNTQIPPMKAMLTIRKREKPVVA